MTKSTITIGEYHDELLRLERATANSEMLTTCELADKTGWARNRVRELLRQAFKQGRLKNGHKLMPAINGGMHRVDCYEILPAPNDTPAAPAKTAKAGKNGSRKRK